MACRVSSHVSDQADRAFVTQLDALIKLLGQHHGLLHRKAEFARSFLLDFRRNEWWNRIAFPFLGGDIGNDELLLPCFGNDLVGLRLALDEYFGFLQILIEATRLNGLLTDFEQARVKCRR